MRNWMHVYQTGLKCCGTPESLDEFRYARVTNNLAEVELNRWIAHHGHEIDPFDSDETAIEIDKRFLVRIHGDILLSDVVLRGLSTLHRSGTCKRLNNREHRMRMAVNLGAGELDGECIANLLVFSYEFPQFTLNFTVDYIEVFIDFCYDHDSGLDSVLHDFKINDATNLELWISGWSVFDLIINPILNLVTKFYKKTILSWIQDEVCDVLNEKMYKFQLPTALIHVPSRNSPRRN